MSIISLENLHFVKHADYRPWGCHMCKFHAYIINGGFGQSQLYHPTKVFVKFDTSQFMYSYLAENYFPDFRVVPPAKLLADTNMVRVKQFKRSAPSQNVPVSKVRKWRKELHTIYASVTPVYMPSYLNHGRRLYDGVGDCRRFMERTNDYNLFQIVFLDYLFGCKDRIANCFTLDGSLFVLDTGFSPDPPPSHVNFGVPSDYLDFHVHKSDLCHLRKKYVVWYSNLMRFVNASRWFRVKKHIPRSFVTEEQVVHTRARVLFEKLHHCA